MGEKRQRLLPLSRRFANLPSGTKAKYVHPESFYSFGWSHGKEKLAGGRPDVTKGSFYNNPTTNRPFDDEDIIAEFPSVRPSYIHTAGMLSPLHTAHALHTLPHHLYTLHTHCTRTFTHCTHCTHYTHYTQHCTLLVHTQRNFHRPCRHFVRSLLLTVAFSSVSLVPRLDSTRSPQTAKPWATRPTPLEPS